MPSGFSAGGMRRVLKLQSTMEYPGRFRSPLCEIPTAAAATRLGIGHSESNAGRPCVLPRVRVFAGSGMIVRAERTRENRRDALGARIRFFASAPVRGSRSGFARRESRRSAGPAFSRVRGESAGTPEARPV